MKNFIRTAVLIAMCCVAGVANAYKLEPKGSDRIDVYCNEGPFVGSMFWNGTRWSDGLRSDPNPDVVAKQMVAAQGSACT